MTDWKNDLRTLADMQQKFGLVTGLSDHTIDNTTAITSVALGVSIIEKHVTLNRNGGGPDDSFGVSCAAQRKRPLVTYFSFALGLGLDDRGVDPFPKDPRLGWYDLFCGSHLAFAQLALRRPDVDFVIKTKWLGQWTKLIEQVLQDGDVELDKLHNLNIQSSGDAHSLIFESLVVCSFASTTILEASFGQDTSLD